MNNEDNIYFRAWLKSKFDTTGHAILSGLGIVFLLTHAMLFVFCGWYQNNFSGNVYAHGAIAAFLGFLLIPGAIFEFLLSKKGHFKEHRVENVTPKAWLFAIVGTLVTLLSSLAFVFLGELAFGIASIIGFVLLLLSIYEVTKNTSLRLQAIDTILSKKSLSLIYSLAVFIFLVHTFGEINSIFPIDQNKFSFTIVAGITLKFFLFISGFYILIIIFSLPYLDENGQSLRKMLSKVWSRSTTENLEPIKFWFLHYFFVVVMLLLLLLQDFTLSGRTKFLASVAFELDFNSNFKCKGVEKDVNKAIIISPDHNKLFIVSQSEVENYKYPSSIGELVSCGNY